MPTGSEVVAYPAVPTGSLENKWCVSYFVRREKNKLYVVERSFSTGRLACTIRVFLADMNEATQMLPIQIQYNRNPPQNLFQKIIIKYGRSWPLY